MGVIKRSGDRVSSWAAAVVVDSLCYLPLRDVVDQGLNSTPLAAWYVYTESPLFHCDRGRGLTACRLVLSSKDTILRAVGCDICKPSSTLSR